MTIESKRILRGDLKKIYEKLSNDDKKKWADKSDYTSYRGLYRYISYSPTEEAYPRLVRGLIETVGEARFNDLFGSVSDALNVEATSEAGIDIEENIGFIDIANTTELKVKFVEAIFNSDDIEMLEKARRDLEVVIEACNNQLNRLKIESEL